MTADAPSPQDVVAGYEALLLQTRRMLEATDRQEWETLVSYESDYVLQTRRLRRLDETVPLTDAHRRRKAELIEHILENNLRVRDRLVVRRDELGELIGTTRRQRNLSRAYGVQPVSTAHLHTPTSDDTSHT
ncbi:flagellar protein FliT [Halomonas shengliensis]|uniref:Flagellar protein FliT n=1 Tax=Halomonas shengliensis TaxID=419597 RepID=A0A1H0F0E4_9GAMM|nr:flagellar protein FliT [Halomonas shengliensis]SDN88137.1 flagellar protein FliT [Halomonas shengliensis]